MTARIVFLVIAGICLLGPQGVTAVDFYDCAEQFSDDAVNFIDHVWTTARIRRDLSDQQRQKEYDSAMKKLVSLASELHMDTDGLTRLARACIEHEEFHRKPPPGWDPDDTKGNLILFSETATRIVSIHLQLISYGRRHCR